MADDTSVVEQEVALDDDNIPDIPLTQMDAPVEDKPSEPAEEGKDDAADAKDEADTDDKKSEGDQPPADDAKAEGDDEATKRQHNDEMARQRIANRQQTQSKVAKDLNEVYGPKTQEQFVADGKTPEEARYEALEARMAHNEEVSRIATLNADMTLQSASILQEESIYNPKSEEYDEEFTNKVDQMYYKRANVQFQELPDGRQVIVNADFPLDEFYKEQAELHNRGVTKGSQRGQKEAMESFARTENVGGSSTSGNQSNSLDDLEERLGDMPIT